MLLFISLNAQETNFKFGIKGGGNYAKYTVDLTSTGMDPSEFKRKIGFYFGGFVGIKVNEKIKIQPEVLFALQGAKILTEGIELRGGPNEIPIAGDFEANIDESIIIAPIAMQYFFTENFYMEAGPQFGYIINIKENIKENPFEEFGVNNTTIYFLSDYNKLDFELLIGAGYKLSNNLGLNSRFLFGLTERGDSMKASVFNLGIEYTL